MLWTTFDMLRGYPLQCSVADNRFYVVGVCGGDHCCGGHTCCEYHLYVVGICCGQHLSIVYVVGVDMLWVTCIHIIYQCSSPHLWVPWIYVVGVCCGLQRVLPMDDEIVHNGEDKRQADV